MSPRDVRSCFAFDYPEARARFLEAASQVGASLESHVLPGHVGALGEPLTLDTAYLGDGEASTLLIVSSGMHGVEGFCGSGCQVAFLRDAWLRGRLQERGVACLLIHAVNPYGFSHLRRTNEDNIDLNRNFLPPGGQPDNPAYAELHDLLIPEQWPPPAEVAGALQRYIERRGHAAFREALTIGQATHRHGLFHSGTAPSWSNTTLRAILRAHGRDRSRIAWVDVHTGLGPFGHGEKIHGGLPGAQDSLAATRAIWGADVVAAWANQSASRQVQGFAMAAIREECPEAESLCLALEFGTRQPSSLDALREEQWLRNHPDKADIHQATRIQRQLRDAYYVYDEVWQSMILAQSRTVLLQAGLGL